MPQTAPDLPPPAAILTAALERLNIKTIQAPEFFGVSRQTLSGWTSGRAKIPPRVFLTIVAIENKLADILAEQAARVEERAAAMRSLASTLNARTPGENAPQKRRAKRNSI